MSDILLISGSPSANSRSGALLRYAAGLLEAEGLGTATVNVRDFPAEDLVLGKYDSPAFEGFHHLVREARGIVIATPVYKASFTGSLKTLLDILPQQAFLNKTLLPIASGGSPAHLLVLDYAIKPVLGSLAAFDILQGIYVTEKQVQVDGEGQVRLDDEIRTRLHQQIETLAAKVSATALA